MEIIAIRYNRWVSTDASSVHRGERLPADGVALDIEGNIYRQVIMDPGWWEWEWRPTGQRVKLPHSVLRTAQDFLALRKGEEMAYEAIHSAQWDAERVEAENRMWHIHHMREAVSRKLDRLAAEKGLL